MYVRHVEEQPIRRISLKAERARLARTDLEIVPVETQTGVWLITPPLVLGAFV